MKSDARISLSVAIALGALLCPHASWAHVVDTTQGTQQSSSTVIALHEAKQMVAGAVELKRELDSRKIHPGQTFQARLDQTIHLKNGPELKAGTTLLGEVTADKARSGTDRLSLRFTEARLKDGKTIPIKATVIEVAPPAFDSGIRLADEISPWHGHTLRVDQLNVLRDVDMHSNIDSKNSVSFVAEDNHDVKLDALSQMELAIAERPARQSSKAKGGI